MGDFLTLIPDMNDINRGRPHTKYHTQDMWNNNPTKKPNPQRICKSANQEKYSGYFFLTTISSVNHYKEFQGNLTKRSVENLKISGKWSLSKQRHMGTSWETKIWENLENHWPFYIYLVHTKIANMGPILFHLQFF